MFRLNTFMVIVIHLDLLCLNSTMFRWNMKSLSFDKFRTLKLFKFHYVQMKPAFNISLTALVKSFKFHYVQMKRQKYRQSNDRKWKEFKFHYVQMKPFLKKHLSPNQMLFKFHYVQMKPPFLTFQTSFKKA